MGLFDLFRRREPRVMEDPEFGRMTAPAKARGEVLWELRLALAEDREPVTVLLPGDEVGPSTQAREGLRQLMADFPRTWRMVAEDLLELHRNAASDPDAVDLPEVRAIEDIGRAFVLDVVYAREPGGYELSFSCTYDDHCFTVHIEGDKPRGVQIDG